MALAPDINTEVRQSWVATTDATATNVQSVPIASGQTMSFYGVVSAVRTGGSSGSAGDSAGYQVFATYKNVAGTVSQVGSTTKTSNEDQAAWDVAFTTSGTLVLLQVTGAANNNVDWTCYMEITKVA